MYKRDAYIIKRHGLKNADGLVRIMQFTQCTIQQPLSSCYKQMLDIDNKGLQSIALWGNKRKSLEYTIANKDKLYKTIVRLKDKTNDVGVITELMYMLTEVPNLGMVKAGFVLQMLGFNVACLDSHNLKRLGMKSSDVSLSKGLKKDTKIKKISKYIKFTQKKGTAYWWDSWCDYVAGNIGNKALTNGDMVSEFHVKCIIR